MLRLSVASCRPATIVLPRTPRSRRRSAETTSVPEPTLAGTARRATSWSVCTSGPNFFRNDRPSTSSTRSSSAPVAANGKYVVGAGVRRYSGRRRPAGSRRSFTRALTRSTAASSVNGAWNRSARSMSWGRRSATTRRASSDKRRCGAQSSNSTSTRSVHSLRQPGCRHQRDHRSQQRDRHVPRAGVRHGAPVGPERGSRRAGDDHHPHEEPNHRGLGPEPAPHPPQPGSGHAPGRGRSRRHVVSPADAGGDAPPFG